MSNVVWPFIFLTYLSIFCLGFLDNIRGPLFSEILKNFSLTDGQGAWFFTTASIFSLVGSISSFFIVQKTDRIQGLRLSLFMFLFGGIIISISPNVYTLLFGAAVLGVGFGLSGALQNILVTIGSTSHRRQQFVTGLHAMYGLASLLAPLLVAVMMKYFNQWRYVFAVSASFPVLVIIYTFFITPDLFHRANKQHDEIKIKSKIWTLDKIYLASIIGIYTMVELLVATRLSLYLHRKYFFTLEKSSLYLSYFYFFFLFSRLIFSAKKFDFQIKNQISMLLLFSAITLVIGFFLEPWFLILSGLFMAPCFPLFMTYLSEKYRHDLDSTMLVVFSLQSFFVVSMHILVGYLSDIFGLNRAIWIGPFLLILALGLLLQYEYKKKKNAELLEHMGQFDTIASSNSKF
jgi:MFS family permease